MPMSHDENVSRDRILTINAGSSSIKFAVFESGSFRRTLSGRIEGIGSSEAVLAVDAGGSAPSRKERIEAPDPPRANERLIDCLKAEDALQGVAAVINLAGENIATRWTGEPVARSRKAG